MGYNEAMKTIPDHTLKFLDSWLTLRSKWAEIPGFVVAVAKDGEVIFNKAYGYADIDTKEPLTPEHMFRVASQSKTFTATAIMQLQEAGKLRIDDRVVDHIDWLKEHRDQRWQEVTIRQVLSHSAGVIRDGLDADYWQLKRAFPDQEQFKDAILDADLVIEPNTNLKYSNYGYSLLGLVIEAASGVTYEEYVIQNIFTPLTLTDVQVEYTPGLHMTQGYTRMTPDRSRYAVPHVTTNVMAPATGFCATARDLCRYYSAQLIGSNKLLSDTSKRDMQHRHWEVPMTSEHGAYGLGFEYARYGGRDLLGHGGGFPGHITQTVFDGDDQLVVTVLTNCNGFIGGMVSGIVSVLYEMGDKEPSDELMKYQGRFSDLWGIYEIVAVGDELRGVWPNSWWPFSLYETLEVTDENTLSIKKTNGFYSPGESIAFVRNDDGSIRSVRNAGTTMRPSVDGDVQPAWM